jgi:hypothetical protein
MQAIMLLEIAEQQCEALQNERLPEQSPQVTQSISDDFIRDSFLVQGERNALLEVVKMLTGGKFDSKGTGLSQLSQGD